MGVSPKSLKFAHTQTKIGLYYNRKTYWVQKKTLQMTGFIIVVLAIAAYLIFPHAQAICTGDNIVIDGVCCKDGDNNHVCDEFEWKRTKGAVAEVKEFVIVPPPNVSYKPDEWCGDGICQWEETCSQCSMDCSCPNSQDPVTDVVELLKLDYDLERRWDIGFDTLNYYDTPRIKRYYDNTSFKITAIPLHDNDLFFRNRSEVFLVQPIIETFAAVRNQLHRQFVIEGFQKSKKTRHPKLIWSHYKSHDMDSEIIFNKTFVDEYLGTEVILVTYDNYTVHRTDTNLDALPDTTTDEFHENVRLMKMPRDSANVYDEVSYFHSYSFYCGPNAVIMVYRDDVPYEPGTKEYPKDAQELRYVSENQRVGELITFKNVRKQIEPYCIERFERIDESKTTIALSDEQEKLPELTS